MNYIETAQESNTALLHWQPELETECHETIEKKLIIMNEVVHLRDITLGTISFAT